MKKIGYLTAVGTQVGKDHSEMYIEIDNQRISPGDKKITIEVEDKK